MKFLHAADIHLDSPMAGLGVRTGVPDAIVHGCTRQAFRNMIDLAIAEDVAFVVIAGDLYDGDSKDFSTGLFFAEEMRRLDRPCFLLRGNHDAHSVITPKLTLPPNVHEFPSGKCETFERPNLGVALHGRSFPKRAVPENLAAGYHSPVRGLLNIGVLHTSAEDPGEHESYAPCRVAELELHGYQYWALGHIHKRGVLSERPWIVFPGNLQGRHPKETGAKGCTLVTVEDRSVVAVEHRSVDVLRWAAIEVDVSGLDIVQITARLSETAAQAVADADGRPVLARVTLTGRTPLHGRLVDDTEHLAAECQQAGGLWVEQVRVRTRPVTERSADLLAPLHEAFLAGLDDPDTVAALLNDLADLRRKVPADARGDLVLPDDVQDLRLLVQDAWAEFADRLAQEDQP